MASKKPTQMPTARTNSKSKRTDQLPNMSTPQPRRAKRRRLNFACNYCRTRKTRCDEKSPSCLACLVAGVPCVTTDKRRPGVDITRREAGYKPLPDESDTGGASVSEREGNQTAFIERGWLSSTLAPPPMTPGANVLSGNAQGPPSSGSPRFTGPLPLTMARQADAHASTSLDYLSDWFDLALYRLGIRGPSHVAASFAATDFEEAWSIHQISTTGPPSLPTGAASQTLLNQYFCTVHLVYPLLDRDTLRRDLYAACGQGPARFSETHSLSTLVRLYLVLGLGLLNGSGNDRGLWDALPRAVLFCKTALGHVIGHSSLGTVQVLFLLALCLKSLDAVSSAWSTLSIAVSLAKVLGLDRPQSKRRRSDTPDPAQVGSEGLHTWWSVYCFDKLFAFELGRSSLISDDDRQTNSAAPAMPLADLGFRHSQLLETVVGLARVLDQIGRKCVAATKAEENAGEGPGLQSVITIKVNTTGETCLMLMDWAKSVPEEFRPTSDMTFNPTTCPFTAFISLQYNNALIMLARNSLLIGEEAIHQAVNIIAKDKPWEFIIRNGQSTTANAARRICRVLIESADSGQRPLMPSLSAPMQALYILSVHLIRCPHLRMSRADISLIQDAADFAKDMVKGTAGEGCLAAVLRQVEILLANVRRSISDDVASWAPPALSPPSNSQDTFHSHSNSELPLSATNSQSHVAKMHHREGNNLVGPASGYILAADYHCSLVGMEPQQPPGEYRPSQELPDGIGWDRAGFGQLFEGTIEGS